MKVQIVNPYFDNELNRNTRVGEVLNVTKERADVLSGNNCYGITFGVKLEEEIETEVVKPVEKAVKKATKKAKK